MTNVQFQSMNKLTQSDDYTIMLARKHIGEKSLFPFWELKLEFTSYKDYLWRYLKLTSRQCILTLSTIISHWRRVWRCDQRRIQDRRAGRAPPRFEKIKGFFL